MTESKWRKFVVLIDRDELDRAKGILSELQQIAGVEVSAQGRSSMDITTDEQLIAQEELEGIVRGLGAQLHPLPEAQLMDPIPPKKIP